MHFGMFYVGLVTLCRLSFLQDVYQMYFTLKHFFLSIHKDIQRRLYLFSSIEVYNKT